MNLEDRFADAVSVTAAFLPKLVGALIVLLVGYLIAKLLQSITTRGLAAAGIDDRVNKSDASSFTKKLTTSPSRLTGRVIYWIVFLSVLAVALSVLEIGALNQFLASVYGYLPNILGAALILIVAGVISAASAAAATRLMGGTPTGKIVAIAIPGITMTIAVFMALNQLRIAEDIVNITFTALVGSLAVGAALAFGLGGREVARQVLQDAYDQGRIGVEQTKSDIATAQENAKQMAEEIKPKENTEGSRDPDIATLPSPAFGETLDGSKPKRRK